MTREVSRRSFCRLTGASVAAAALGSSVATADTAFDRVDAATEKAVRAVTVSAEGPYAVAGNGDLLARRVDGWERVRDAGPTLRDKGLYGTAASDDGRNVWLVGESAVVARYDVVDEVLTDHSGPNDLSTTWYDAAVVGTAGSETVYLASSGGDVLRGTREGGGMNWDTAESPNGGNAIYAIVEAGGDLYICDSTGSVYRSTDDAETWTDLGPGASVPLYDLSVRDGVVTAVGGSGNVFEDDGSGWTTFQPSGSAIRSVDHRDGERIAVGNGGKHYHRASDGWTTTDMDTAKTLRGVRLDDDGPYPDTIVGNAGRVFERDSFTAYPDRIRIETAASDDIDYAFDVGGPARKAPAADADDSVSDTSGGYHVSGTVGGSDDADAYDYGGDLGGFTVTSGSAADLTTSVSGTTVSVERLTDRSWASVATPVSVTLHEVVEASTGCYAVGDGGVVLARDGGDWTVVDDDGPGDSDNSLYGAGVTDDGGAVWVGGGSGAAGRLDPETDEITDHTAPNGETSTWTDVAVAGATGDERVLLTNGSGEVLRGEYGADGVTWADPVKPGNGSTIRGVTLLDESTAYVCDDNSRVFRSDDGGRTWTDVGIPDAGVTLYDVAAVATDDVTVVGGSGRLFQYNGDVWTPVALGGNSRYSVDRQQDRGVAVGGGAEVFERELDGWAETADDGSDVGLRGTLVTSDPSVPKVAVGGNGVVLEQSFDDPLY